MPCIPYENWTPEAKTWLADYLTNRAKKCPLCQGCETHRTEHGVWYCRACGQHYYVHEVDPAPGAKEGR